jgi:hypothetical protein
VMLFQTVVSQLPRQDDATNAGGKWCRIEGFDRVYCHLLLRGTAFADAKVGPRI